MLTAANSDTVAEQVRHGTAYIGFVEGPASPKGLRNRIIGHDRLNRFSIRCGRHHHALQPAMAPYHGGYCLVGGPLGLVTVGEGFWDGEVVAGPAASGCPGSGAGVAPGDGLAEALESSWVKWMPGTVTSA